MATEQTKNFPNKTNKLPNPPTAAKRPGFLSNKITASLAATQNDFP